MGVSSADHGADNPHFSEIERSPSSNMRAIVLKSPPLDHVYVVITPKAVDVTRYANKPTQQHVSREHHGDPQGMMIILVAEVCDVSEQMVTEQMTSWGLLH